MESQTRYESWTVIFRRNSPAFARLPAVVLLMFKSDSDR
jgi:hypothetical protein